MFNCFAAATTGYNDVNNYFSASNWNSLIPCLFNWFAVITTSLDVWLTSTFQNAIGTLMAKQVSPIVHHELPTTDALEAKLLVERDSASALRD